MPFMPSEAMRRALAVSNLTSQMKARCGHDSASVSVSCRR